MMGCRLVAMRVPPLVSPSATGWKDEAGVGWLHVPGKGG